METQFREKKVIAATSVGAAVFLTGAKLAVGLWTGSLGILAEAAHSGLDLAAAVITFFAVRVSDQPADESHLYGHGKVENLSALAETFLLLITCVWIIYEAVQRLFFETIEVDPSLWAFLIMGMSIVIDFSRSRALGRVAKKYRSQALEADALHFSTDIWSSAVVIIGLALVKIGDLRGGDKAVYQRADAIAALVVSLIVIHVSYRLGRRAVDALLDRAPQGLAEQLSRSVEDVSGIRRVTRTRVRDVGNRIFVDMEIDVPRHLSLEESHELTQKAQQAVRRISPGADVVVDTVPIAEGEGIVEKIRAAASREHVSVHNITTHWTERGIWIDLDIEVDPDASFERAHEQATKLENKLRTELIRMNDSMPVAEINAHIEPRVQEPILGAQLDAAEAETYAERVKTIGRELGSGECHDIELHRIDGRIYLSCHVLVNAAVPMAEVHRIAEEIENRLRREFPELGRVVIHTEPVSRE
ncbi:MAG: cation diffusion facilitator family transporter [Acidobacteria bacterium]|nr:cation diffusion facilitator family transporter [Acidobacteriota bacterium]